MSDFLDPVTIIFLCLAVFLFMRLRNTLGSRTGNERPPVDQRLPTDSDANHAGNDNVISLPRSTRKEAQSDANDPADQQEAIKEAFSSQDPAISSALAHIARVDDNFSDDEFLEGAAAAYEMIVMAFAAGDKDTLRDLLSEDVYKSFAQAIEDRASRSETIEQTFVGLDSKKIVSAELRDDFAHVTVRFVSQLISATLDSESRVIDGDPNAVIEAIDIWTFARDTRSSSPNWELVATETAE